MNYRSHFLYLLAKILLANLFYVLFYICPYKFGSVTLKKICELFSDFLSNWKVIFIK